MLLEDSVELPLACLVYSRESRLCWAVEQYACDCLHALQAVECGGPFALWGIVGSERGEVWGDAGNARL